jgi:hypothetical protein
MESEGLGSCMADFLIICQTEDTADTDVKGAIANISAYGKACQNLNYFSICPTCLLMKVRHNGWNAATGR